MGWESPEGRQTDDHERTVLDRLFQFLGSAEGDLLRRLDLDAFASGRVATHARGALADLEDAKTDEADLGALLELLGDRCDDVREDRLDLLLRQFVRLGGFGREMLQSDDGAAFLAAAALAMISKLLVLRLIRLR